MDRVLHSLKERHIALESSNERKIVALSADLSQADLGVGKEMMEQFITEVSLIMHLAWPVNFSIHLQSFEPHLTGLRTLLTLSLDVYRSEPARLYFASSISTAENTPPPALIPNAPIDDFSHALDMGYAESKLVGEHMVLNAARGGARSYVLRIGQIVGDKQSGFWNDSEFVPLMIRSALPMKVLPALEEDCSWIPVDTLATTILEVDRTLQSAPRPCHIDSMNPPVIYNMCNPRLFSWGELLQELRTAGLEFEVVPYSDWLHRLQDSALTGDVEQNPAVKLLDHFELRYNLSNEASVKDADVNGTKVNGTEVSDDRPNGTKVNGTKVNGDSPNGTKVNGTKVNGTKVNGASPHENETSVKDVKVNGTQPNNASPQETSTKGTKANGTKSKDPTPNDTPKTRGVQFDTSAVLRDSSVLRHAPDIIGEGYVQKFMSHWLERWTPR